MCPAIASGIITGDRLFSRLAYKLSSNFFTSASGRLFYVFLRQKRARERELLVLGPTTGTGSEKRRTLRKSVPSNSPRSQKVFCKTQNFFPVSKVMNGGQVPKLIPRVSRAILSSLCESRKKSDPAKRVQPVLPANIFQEMAKKQIGDCNFRSLLYLTIKNLLWHFDCSI